MAVTDDDVLDQLRRGEYVSCEAIGVALGVSRRAVHKHVYNLRAQGYAIRGVPRKGVILEASPEGDVSPASPRSSSTPEEQPANKAADRASSLPDPPPFAGIEFADIDVELYTIGEVIRLAEPSSAGACARRRRHFDRLIKVHQGGTL